jgi:hypothetical protein
MPSQVLNEPPQLALLAQAPNPPVAPANPGAPPCPPERPPVTPGLSEGSPPSDEAGRSLVPSTPSSLLDPQASAGTNIESTARTSLNIVWRIARV